MLSVSKVKLDQMKVLVTSECNLNCTHCFRSSDKHKFNISKEKIIEIVDYALLTECRSISFSGGEFFMYPFAYELLEYCYRKKLPVKILTNATKLDQFEFFEKYKGTNLLSFQISLDGMRKNHDLRRGKGLFDIVTENVKKLKEYGIHTTVSMTVDKVNMYDVVDVMQLPFFDDFNFLPVAFAGEETKRGRPVMDEAYDEYENIIRVLYKSKAEVLDKSYRCRMFPYQLGIRYDGTVYPCAVARDYGIFCLGSIYEKPIATLVDDFIQSDAASELLNYCSNDIPECSMCEAKDICSRGCRARAYKYYGRLLAPDPFCCKLFEHGFNDVPINCVFWGES